MRIGELAGRSGLTPDTLRYYEREGLLPYARRSSTGQRQYDEKILDQLVVIKAFRNAGFGISAIQAVLSVKAPGLSPSERISAMREVLDELADELAARQTALDEARTFIERCQTELADAV